MNTRAITAQEQQVLRRVFSCSETVAGVEALDVSGDFARVLKMCDIYSTPDYTYLAGEKTYTN